MMKSKLDAFKAKPVNERVNTVALAVASVVAVGALVAGAVSTMSYNGKLASLTSEYDSLQKEYNGIMDKSVEMEEAVVILNSAKDAGSAVAAIQNQLSIDKSLIGTDEEQVYVDEANSLSEYFSSASASYPWYLTEVLSSDDYKWEFNTMYSFTADTVPVLWTCYGDILSADNNRHHVLLAYANGVYNVESGKFGSMDINITSLGYANQVNKETSIQDATKLVNDDDIQISRDDEVVITDSNGHEKSTTDDILESAGVETRETDETGMTEESTEESTESKTASVERR